jgi:hypothetical protein
MAQGGLVVGAKKTAYNRTVYASPPEAARGSGWLGHSATLHSHAVAPAHFVRPANLRFAYSGGQNVVNSRNVMRNGG